MFAVALYLLVVCRRWRAVAIMLIVISAAWAFPMPSNAAITLQLTNTTTQIRQISILRDRSPSRAVHFTLQPGERRIYKTAPGDWPPSASFSVRAESFELTRPISDFRRSLIVISPDAITLLPVQS